MDSESVALKINVSDSAYSKSCTNSNSQKSGSSKSHPNSGSNSSKTSGYDGTTNGANESLDAEDQGSMKRIKEKEYKKKKFKQTNTNVLTGLKNNENCSTVLKDCKIDVVMGVEIVTNNLIDGSDVTNQNLQGSKNDEVTSFFLNESMTVEDAFVKETTSSGKDNLETINDSLIATNNNITDLISMPLIDQVDSINKINTPVSEDGFCCVISMSDGLVLYTTSSLTNILGFPKHMWLGRSFTDFVHPKDREAFLNEITTGVAIPLIDAMGKKRDVKSSLYVYLRKYRGLKSSGYGVIEKTVAYQAFHLSVKFKNATEYADSIEMSNNGGVFLVIVAIPLYSSYKVPCENTKSNKFAMRHTSACTFSHVDAEVVMNFGYFPQDMLGKSVFDFYHPEDMPFMKEVYKSVMSHCQIAGSVYRSKPYRFAVKNGDFVMVESEWSCFINPWSRRLEFITGLHQVMQGPSNPDVFEVPNNDDNKPISQEVLREAKVIQEEIIFLLKRELVKPIESARFEVSTRCKNLATFMETIMCEVTQTDVKVDSPANHNVSVSERESVMLGEISPHHDYYDRESSSETPPSYNQLNYHENLHRFFKSKPMTTGSDESVDKTIVVVDSELSSHQGRNQKCLSPIQNSGDSGSGSAENLSSESNQIMDAGVTSGTNTCNSSYRRPHLTEKLLLKHNVDMEKIMRQRHREQRFNDKADKGSKKAMLKSDKKIEKENIKKFEEATNQQGTKRSVSRSWDGDNHKMSKLKHNNELANASEEKMIKNKDFNKLNAISNENNTYTPNNYNENNYNKAKNVNLWPPFSVSMTSLGNTQSYNFNTASNHFGTYSTGMFPLYYFQTQQNQITDCNLNTQQSHFQVQYVPSMMYNCNPVFPTSSMFCPPMTVMPYPMAQPITPFVQEPKQRPVAPVCVTNCNEMKLSPRIGDSVPELQRCISQPTSVKAEPGSAIGSVVSTSGLNRAMSECSRKDYGLLSVCSPDFPLVSPPDGESHLDCGNLPEKNINKTEQTTASNMIRQDEESSYSSFYSSFLKTDTGSGSNDDSTAMGSTNKFKDKGKYEKPIAYPKKKCDPPWMEAVSVTPELIYRYQMSMKNLEDILEADLKTLKSIEQPVMVNNQLDQLYLEMELAGLSTKLTLEEGITSSSSSGEDNATNDSNKLKKRKGKNYSSITMIYEENAPFPSPEY